MSTNATEFKARYLGFHPKLYHIAFALIGDQQEAEDIVQETYLKLWQNREKLIEINNPEAYCVTLVKNLSLDLLRSKKVRRTSTIEECFSLADNKDSFSTIENKDMLQLVKQIIMGLPQQQQQVLRLKCVSDFSLEEIEELTGLKNGNIRTLLSRARSTVKIKLNQLIGNDE